MELTRRKLHKHLEPARPLRRFTVDEGKEGHLIYCQKPQVDQKENNVTVDQLCNIILLHKPKQERISYTRDVLLELASSPVAQKKPEYLPEHPIVLEKARDFMP